MSSLSNDDLLIIHAYVDGELDPANALEIERRFEAEPTLASERDRVTALRNVLRERVTRERAPAALRQQLESRIGRNRERPFWRMLAAAVLLAALVASGATWLVVRGNAPNVTPNLIVASHMRALLAPQPFDVASSDRHTVKPWFNGRIPQSPTVVDLTADGFPLAGGRIDVIGRMPVPTLVYRHDKHLISLTAMRDTAPANPTIDGYNVVSWRDGAIVYWAVSDIARADLEAFAKAFQSAAKEG
jgi:anti-sigma factor RsiW